jgi:hypothetical protein
MKDNPSLVADGSRITETGKAKKRKERPKREKKTPPSADVQH